MHNNQAEPSFHASRVHCSVIFHVYVLYSLALLEYCFRFSLYALFYCTSSYLVMCDNVSLWKECTLVYMNEILFGYIFNMVHFLSFDKESNNALLNPFFLFGNRYYLIFSVNKWQCVTCNTISFKNGAFCFTNTSS